MIPARTRSTALPLAAALGFAAVLWGAAALAQTVQPAGSVIDRVVAVVQIRTGVGARSDSDSARLPAEVITLSGLEFEARVALIQRGAMRAATEPLDDEALRSALDYAINERLLAGEAEVLGAWRVEPAEVDAALRAFRERFDSDAQLNAFLARYEADVQSLGRVLERSLRANKVLDSKVRLRAQVSESEVRRYFDEHRDELHGSWDDLRAPLRDKLVRERYQALVETELEQLRRTHDVRRIAPFARQGSGRGQG